MESQLTPALILNRALQTPRRAPAESALSWHECPGSTSGCSPSSQADTGPDPASDSSTYGPFRAEPAPPIQPLLRRCSLPREHTTCPQARTKPRRPGDEHGAERSNEVDREAHPNLSIPR